MFFMIEKKKNAYEARRTERLGPTPHLHSHIEIILSKEGSSICVADNNECELCPGDLFISFPNQIHYYLDNEKRGNYCILIVSPDVCPEFSRIFKTMVPRCPILKNAIEHQNIVWAIERAIDAHRAGAEFSQSEIRGYLLVLFSELFRLIPLTENGSCETDIVKSIINFCYENYDSDISLQSISDELHISRYYISHLFSRKLHTGFNDYINSLRISRACEILKANDSPITEIAYAVGYNSIRTFNRCFLHIMNMSPKDYRNRHHSKKEKA